MKSLLMILNARMACHYVERFIQQCVHQQQNGRRKAMKQQRSEGSNNVAQFQLVPNACPRVDQLRLLDRPQREHREAILLHTASGERSKLIRDVEIVESDPPKVSIMVADRAEDHTEKDERKHFAHKVAHQAEEVFLFAEFFPHLFGRFLDGSG